jgi:hypothetical protein
MAEMRRAARLAGTVDRRRPDDFGEVNAGMPRLPQISPRAAPARTRHVPGADVVTIRPDPVTLAPVLRAAAGFRVDGPDGRIGVLHGVSPDEPTAPPQRLLISMGLFIVTTASIAVGEVRSVDGERQRIVVAATPRPCAGAARESRGGSAGSSV